MKKTKRIFAVVLLLTMLFALEITIYSANIYTYRVGANITAKLDEDIGVLTISGSGEMYDYDRDYNEYSSVGVCPYCSESRFIKKIVISEGITGIGDAAFYGLENVSEVVIPSTVKRIGAYSFSCFGTDDITIDLPEGLETIGEGAFKGIKAKEIVIPDSVRMIDYYAFSLTSLERIVIGSGVSDWGDEAFSSNSYLKYLTIKNGVEEIGEDAFSDCTSLTSIILPSSVETVGSVAFSDCKNLKSITFGTGIKSINLRAFRNCNNLSDVYYAGTNQVWKNVKIANGNDCLKNATIHYNSKHSEHIYGTWSETVAASCAHDGVASRTCTICGLEEIKTLPRLEHTFGDAVTVKEPSCTEDGLRARVCTVCGYESEREVIPSFGGHKWGEWKVVKSASQNKDGLRERVCSVCGESESEVIPARGELEYSVGNFDLSVANAYGLEYVRAVLGSFGDAESILGAQAALEMDPEAIAASTVDGAFTCTVPDVGVYSFFFRFDDGSTYVLDGVDMTKITPVVSAKEGYSITLDQVYGVRDYFIARGTWTKPNDCKYANRIVRMDVSKYPELHTFTYVIKPTVASPENEYTIMVRYTDPERKNEFIHFSLDLPTPEVNAAGLKVTVTGLEGVKKVTTAQGIYETAGEVKRAEGARVFSAKTTLNGRGEYTIQYRASGEYTIAVEYRNGYLAIFHVDVAAYEPTVSVTSDSVTFGGLDNMYIMRFAAGDYATARDIKDAAGSRYRRPSAIAPDGTITVSNLHGEYTFMVQYTDESQHFYHLTFE